MIKNRFSEKSEPIEISEDELYRSSNCGITTCTQSIAGIIAINGLDELLIKGRLAIERDLYARGKNNIKSLLGGLEILKNNESDFKKNIQEINKLHKDLLLNIEEKIKWEKIKIRAVDVFGKFSESYATIFGIESAITRAYWCSRDSFDQIITNPENFSKNKNFLYQKISYGEKIEINSEDLGLAQIEDCLTGLQNQSKIVRQLNEKFDPDKNKEQILKCLGDASQYFYEKLPENSKIALFRIHQENFSESHPHYPNLFGLKNIDPKVIDFIDKDYSFGQWIQNECNA